MKKTMIIAGLSTLAIAGIAAAEGTQIDIDVSQIANWDSVGSDNNHVMIVDIAAELGLDSGTAVEVTGIGWDVSLQTFGESWYSEAGIYFDDTINPDQLGLFLRPGAADNEGGDEIRNYASGSVLKLDDLGIGNQLLANGELRMEFYESFDDVIGEIDSIWVEGTITIQALAVPAPGALAIVGLAGVVGRRRRRH